MRPSKCLRPRLAGGDQLLGTTGTQHVDEAWTSARRQGVAPIASASRAPPSRTKGSTLAVTGDETGWDRKGRGEFECFGVVLVRHEYTPLHLRRYRIGACVCTLPCAAYSVSRHTLGDSFDSALTTRGRLRPNNWPAEPLKIRHR